MSDTEVISIIAVLKAKHGKTDALKQALQALLLPTRREPGNIEYALFQLRDTPDVFTCANLAGSGRSGRPYCPAAFPDVYPANERSAGRAAASGLSDADCALIS